MLRDWKFSSYVACTALMCIHVNFWLLLHRAGGYFKEIEDQSRLYVFDCFRYFPSLIYMCQTEERWWRSKIIPQTLNFYRQMECSSKEILLPLGCNCIVANFNVVKWQLKLYFSLTMSCFLVHFRLSLCSFQTLRSFEGKLVFNVVIQEVLSLGTWRDKPRHCWFLFRL